MSRRPGERAACRRARVWLRVAWLGLVAAGCAPTGDAMAPEFEHVDLDGNRVALADLRGRTVVIDFWATWCEPCAFQPAELNQVWAAHRESGRVAVLGLEVGGASAEEVRAWAADHEAVADYPILLGASEDLARRYGIFGFPAVVVVDPEGRIDSVTMGLETAAEIEESIAHLVGGESVGG